MSELPGGTLTVLHTDVEDSTLLTVHLGNRYPEILAGRRAGPCGCASASTRENRGTQIFKGLPGMELTVHSTRFLRARTAVLCGPQLTGHVRRTRSCR